MIKLGWGLINRRDSLWVNLMREKYKCGSKLIPVIDKSRVGSHVWQGIKNNWGRV